MGTKNRKIDEGETTQWSKEEVQKDVRFGAIKIQQSQFISGDHLQFQICTSNNKMVNYRPSSD
jgi:hypothetical protein